MEQKIPRERGIFCNRTLNLRSIRAIGYDMDYTLIHYNVEEWEGRAYDHIKQRLLQQDWPVADLTFDSQAVTRGLVIDQELGNVVKANRFGYIKRAFHGTKLLEYQQMREMYSRTLVDLSDSSRYYFLNTFFSLSEACIFMQLVDLLDRGRIPEVLGYRDLFQRIRRTLDEAHAEGDLKGDILSDPERYVELDPNTVLMLQDQRAAGKKLMLITNSEWEYTQPIMNYAFGQYLPEGTKWQDLFDLVVVSSRKPNFFSGNSPFFEVVSEDGLLRPARGPLENDKVYLGGNAAHIEKTLGIAGSEILYVGDHIFSDVNISKSLLRWRTALIVRELEEECQAIEANQADQAAILDMMDEKIRLEDEFSMLRLAILRKKNGYGPQVDASRKSMEQEIQELRERLVALDQKIGPLASQVGSAFNQEWGYLMRTGNDKSHITRQIETYADIYTSRVSNFLFYTPFMFFRSPRGSLPHDMPPGNDAIAPPSQGAKFKASKD